MADGGSGSDSGEWKPPEHFEEYRIVRALGRGAMGSVYLAHDSLLDRPVAVKFIAADDPDADTRDRFFVEARAVARLQHPNVVAIFRVGELRGRPYLVSEFLRGESLDHVKKPLEWQRVLQIGIELTRGLAAAHRRGVLHRDIKPANAMLTEDGGVKLLDFGLAKFLDSAGPSPHATLLGLKAADLVPARVAAAEAAGPGQTVTLPEPESAPAASPAQTLSLPPPSAAPSPAQTATSSDPAGAPPANEGDRSTRALDSFAEPPASGLDPAPPASFFTGSTWVRPSAASVPVEHPDSVPVFGSADTRIRESQPGAASATPPLPAPLPVVVTAATLDLTRSSPRKVASGSRDPLDLSKRSPSLTGDGAVLGSPLYMAPEAWRSDPATPRTDVYSMGVLLYELAAGGSPWHGLSVPQIAASTLQKDAPPLRERNPKVDPALAAVIDRCLRREPAERYESGEALREALESLAAPAPVAAVLPEGNPYRGLLTFEAEHRSLFFGRGAEIRAILDRLRSESRVVVAGDSGVGKSSLCRAGVLPAILDGAMGGEPPTVLRLIPGRHPVASLAAVLSAQLGKEEAEVAAWLHADPSQLGRELRKAAPKGGTVLFIDQLEELVTLSDPDEARVVAEALGSLAISAAGLRVLGTARSDFLGRLAGLPGFGDELARVLYLLKPLGEDGVREAIVAPARALGFGFETGAMVQSLVDAATRADGSLPLLQFALSELWEARDVARKIIPASALERMGGVEGALAEHADGVLHSLVGGQRGAARRILLKLVTPERTRARKSEAELVAGDPEARRALETLVRGRLVVARDTEEGEGSYEVAHEALLTGWTTLREWLSSNKETRAAQARLETAAGEWLRLDRTRDALWSPRQLEEIRIINPDDLGSTERAFLDESRRSFRRKRLVRWMGASGAVLGVGLIIGGVQWREQQALRAKVEARLAEADQHTLRTEGLSRQAEEVRRQAFELFHQKDPRPAEDRWVVARRLAREAELGFHEAERHLESARSLAPADPQVMGRLAGLTRDRLLLAEQLHQDQRVSELRDRLSLFDHDGTVRAQLDSPAVVSVETDPPGVSVAILSFDPRSGNRELLGRRELGTTPLRELQLPPGSAVLEFSAEGRARVRYPLLLQRGQRLNLAPRIPGRREVPPGFLFVPAGTFLAGSAEDDDLRRTFLFAPPLHPRHTGDYLISERELTYGEWIAFLQTLPPAERAKRTPLVNQSRSYMGVELGQEAGWTLSLALPTARHQAKQGEPLVFPGRARNREVDWSRLPVSGISFSDAEAYARWLHSSGRLPGARMCTEDEWERAARGADGRPFPCGHTLRPDDANYDETYGRVGNAYGPDEVGSHPSCPSPVGLLDASGNVWEWLRSTSPTSEVVYRGGGFYEGALSSRLANRNVGDPHMRDVQNGVRLCADLPPLGP